MNRSVWKMARVGISAGLILVLAACGGDRQPDPTEVMVTMSAASDVNPDRNDRPSPIMVRVYELRSAGVFESADFFGLFEQDQQVLGSDHVNRWEFQLEPGERINLDAEFRSDSGYLGVVAAYRDVEHARWRAFAPIRAHQVNDLEVVLERLEVVVREI